MSLHPENTATSPFTPPEGWVQFGCPDCGNVRMLPAERTDETDRPYCIHHDGNYSWRPDRSGAWTRMVPITVEESPC